MSKPTSRCSAAAVLLGVLAACDAVRDASQPPFDVLVRGGTVLDGTSAAPRLADVGIRGSRIAAIGDLAGASAATVLDASGLHVAPGFIDVHTHVDVEVVRGPACSNFAQMGVTTLITGNCGSSVPDLAAHLERVERGGVGVNYGSLVGHGTVRHAVLGSEPRAPTATELEHMADLVEAAMRAGAFGLSSGLIYVPGTYARTDELTALAKVAARHGGVYASHIRNENDAVLEALDEALTIARDAEVAVHIAHVKCSGWPNHGRAGGVLARLGAARAGGLRVTADQYAYDASSTGIDVWFPDVELAAGREALGRRLASDAAFRDRVREALFRKMDQTGFGDFAFGRIANAKGNEDLNGLPMDAAAAKRFGSSDRHAQAELAMDLFAAAAPSRVDMVFHSMAERDVERFLAVDWIAVASDASIRAEQSVARPHPRGAGNTVRVLGRYVRERGVLDLPTAIRKLTSVPARIFGLEDRGELRVGAFADVVVFDAAQVADQATYTEPLRPPVGIAWVLVNGSLVVDHGTMTGVRTGMVLRRGPRKPA